jgi:hypothetical protein
MRGVGGKMWAVGGIKMRVKTERFVRSDEGFDPV